MKQNVLRKSLLLGICLVLAAGLVFAGGEQEGGEKKLHIGVAAALFDDKWMSYMHDGFRSAAEELGVRITMVDGKGDPAVQQSQIDTFITQGLMPSSSFRFRFRHWGRFLIRPMQRTSPWSR